MKLPAIIPTPGQIGREAITVIAGALIAAWIVNNCPPLRAYVLAAWGRASPPTTHP